MAKFTHTFLKKLENFNKDLPCLIYNNNTYSYDDLIIAISQKLHTLKNIPNASIIAIIGDYNLDSISMLLACLERGLIAVPLMPTNKDEINSKLKEGQVDFIYQDDTLIPLHNTETKHIIIKNLQNTSGLILFSSGSTGKPKAIVHNLSIFAESFLSKKPKQTNILLFLMFDHIGGLNTLFNTLSLGACGVAISNRKNIYELASCIQHYKISLLPASPSLLNLLLLSGVEKIYNLNSLKMITYGTERMPDSLLKNLKLTFPKVRFHQTFGTSEVGITQTTSKDNAIKLEGIQYKIINNELYLKSKTQSLGYLNADNSVFDDEGYFATGDLVEVVESNREEYIKILGRTKELINVGGEKLLPQEVEGVILQMPYIKDCLVYGESNTITGQSVSIKVVLDSTILGKIPSKMELKRQIRIFCKDKLAPFKIPSKVEIVESLQMSERFKKIRIDNRGGGR